MKSDLLVRIISLQLHPSKISTRLWPLTFDHQLLILYRQPNSPIAPPDRDGRYWYWNGVEHSYRNRFCSWFDHSRLFLFRSLCGSSFGWERSPQDETYFEEVSLLKAADPKFNLREWWCRWSGLSDWWRCQTARWLEIYFYWHKYLFLVSILPGDQRRIIHLFYIA